MNDFPDIASVAALIGDRTRASMLLALMDGKAYTATELALWGDVTPSTASSHLARLQDGGLIKQVKQGRHRYFRIATDDIAEMLEKMMSVTSALKEPTLPKYPQNSELRYARVCYDHLAGEMGVRMKERLIERQLITQESETIEITEAGQEWCNEQGIDLDQFKTRRRPLCRLCLDWTERKTHIAGTMGAAILDRLISLKYVKKEAESRVVIFRQEGKRFITDLTLHD